jgi:preprotein translocase subunit SecB
LMLSPINFEALYAQQKQAAQANGNGNDATAVDEVTGGETTQ